MTISLPATWVKKFNIKKGDELDIKEYGSELRINPEKEFGPERKEIYVGDLKRLGKTYLTASYRQGYDEIKMDYSDPQYISTIQAILSKETTGFEIVKQNRNYCLIKDLTGHNKNEFDLALRRIWLLVLDLSKESLDAIKKKNVSELKDIKLLDFNINKFSNYCLRLLIKKGYLDFKKTPLYYHLIESLEKIADQYKDLCTFYSENPNKINDSLIVLFDKINSYLEEFYELFYKYNEEKLEDLFKRTKITLIDSKNNRSYLLFSICGRIRGLLSILVEINL